MLHIGNFLLHNNGDRAIVFAKQTFLSRDGTSEIPYTINTDSSVTFGYTNGRLDSMISAHTLNLVDNSLSCSKFTVNLFRQSYEDSMNCTIISKFQIDSIKIVSSGGSREFDKGQSILNLVYQHPEPVTLSLNCSLSKVKISQNSNIKFEHNGKEYHLISPMEESILTKEIIKELVGLNNFLSRFDIDSDIHDIQPNHYAGFEHFEKFEDKRLLKCFFESNNEEKSYEDVVKEVNNYIFDHYGEIAGIGRAGIQEILNSEKLATDSKTPPLPNEILKIILDKLNPRDPLKLEATKQIEFLDLTAELPFVNVNVEDIDSNHTELFIEECVKTIIGDLIQESGDNLSL